MSTSDFVGLPHEDDVDRTVILLQCQAVLKALNDIVLDRGQFRRKPTLRLKKRGAVFAPNRQ